MATGSPPVTGEKSNGEWKPEESNKDPSNGLLKNIMVPPSKREPQQSAVRPSLGLPPRQSLPLTLREGQDVSLDPGQMESVDEEEQHLPPMNVIVVSSPGTQDRSATGVSSRRTSSNPSAYSAPFRLQPRSTMTLSTPGRDGSVRGRKRSAHSMNSTKAGSGSLLTGKQQDKPVGISDGTGKSNLPLMPSAAAATPKKQLPCGLTPPRNTRRGAGRVDNAMVNFQCLSLQSPKRKDRCPSSPGCFSSPPQTASLRPPSASSSSSAKSARQQRPAMVPGSVGSFQSPALSSAGIQPRSSFTPVINSASPGGSLRSLGSGSIGSNARMNLNSRAASQPESNSARSSPKIAPLTVLHDRGTRVHNTSMDPTARRPPLPSSGLIWHPLASGEEHDITKPPGEEDVRLQPPRTVHCRRPSSDSISTFHNSVLSPLPRPSPKRSPSDLSSPASAPGLPPKANTPRSKQARLDHYSSPNQRTPRTPQTPLPRVTLTPRSASSRRSRHGTHGLPRFPSPSDVDMDVTSPFLNSAAAASLRGASTMIDASGSDSQDPNSRDFSTIRSLFPMSSNSLALSADGSANDGKEGPSLRGSNHKASLPVLNLSSKRSEMEDSKPSSLPSPSTSTLSGGTFMGIHTVSLLHSSRPGGFLRSMMEERAARMSSEGSVSDIDDDEGFILASPSAIEQERLANSQPARQRRRRSCDPFSNATSAARTSLSLDLSPNDASNTNLAGMNNVTSSTSLFGMDIAHPTDHSGAASGDKDTDVAESMSMTKVGALERSADVRGPSSPDTNCFKRRKSDASFDSIGLALDCTRGGRDLVTPPTVPNIQSPPPLSPKAGIGLQHAPTDQDFGNRQNSTVRVAGADRQSVTMAIARMAAEAEGHADSSPVL